MPDAGGCPNCSRPLAAHERVCTSCGYDRESRAVAETRVAGRSAGDIVLHALKTIATHPATIAAIACAAAILLAWGSAGDPKSVRTYSVLTGIVCVVASLIWFKYWWFDASIGAAAEMRVFGWVALLFDKDAPAILRIATLLGVTMAIATAWLRLDLGPAALSEPPTGVGGQ